VLNEYAQALEVLRVAIAQKRLHCGWDEPTEDDVQNARRLVQLVREGAPSEALIEPALRAARVQTDPVELREFHAALLVRRSSWARSIQTQCPRRSAERSSASADGCSASVDGSGASVDEPGASVDE
jgi:hypothetical protein